MNLAPADVRKDSSGLDLPIAVGLLASYGMVPEAAVQQALFSAELSLDGNCRPISGILPMAITAREHGLTEFYVAPTNVDEALLIDGLKVYAVETLAQLVRHLTGMETLTPAVPKPIKDAKDNAFTDDFADVQGQYQTKRALEIAAAGGHNVLMVGVLGSGKTMLARRIPSILPELTKEEAIEITKIYSISGLLGKDTGLVTTRPLRSPHHTSSTVAMIGGGSIPRPGEVTLAHHGVLFLDELPEFSKKTLEVLREPIEDRQITVSRANASLTFPSSIILVASMNPCPCGYFEDKEKSCGCMPNEIKRYAKKLSRTLLDRNALQHIHVSCEVCTTLYSTCETNVFEDFPLFPLRNKNSVPICQTLFIVIPMLVNAQRLTAIRRAYLFFPKPSDFALPGGYKIEGNREVLGKEIGK